MNKWFMILPVLLFVSLLTTQCGGAPEATELDARSVLEKRCTVCHDLGRVERSKKTEAQWRATIERMELLGARLYEGEEELLSKYLAETYPK